MKGRPRFNPLIAHVADVAMAERIARLDPRSLALAQRFWPGPLTLVMPARSSAPIDPLATAGLDTIALRVPVGPLRELSERLNRPLVAPSANRSGKVSPTTTMHVLGDLAPHLDPATDVIVSDELRAGELVGIESTIVSLADVRPTLLRPGGLSRDELEAVIGEKLVAWTSGRVAAPGMLASHYAPQGTVRLRASTVFPDEFHIAFGAGLDPHRTAGGFQLSERGDLREAAANLFAALHAANAAGATRVAVSPIPNVGLGEGLNDRLSRAAAPR